MASADALLTLLAPRVERGQRSLAATLGRVVQAVAGEALARAPAGDQSCLLEPLVIAQVATGRGSAVDVEPLLAGYAERERRPTRLTVQADRAGRVFLPRLGYLIDLPPESQIELARDGRSELGYVPSGTEGAGAIPISALGLGRTQMIMPTHAIPLLDSPAVVSDDAGPLRGVDESAQAGRRPLTVAIGALGHDWPALMELIEATVRYVVLFRDPRRSSFAGLAAHGVVFLNCPTPSVPFFIEDLAHQCGHVLFSAAWQGGAPLLEEPGTAMAEVGGRVADRRSLEVALHGMVTQVLMIEALERFAAGDWEQEQRSEALARLRFALLRLSHDARLFAGADVFTDEGKELFAVLVSAYVQARRLHGERATADDFSTQGYDFDYESYRASNPAPDAADTLAGA